MCVLAGCGSTEGVSDFLARDSSGIQIVESSAAAWSAGEEWLVEESPSLVIGVEEGQEAFQFNRVTSALRLADQRIVVANAGSGELRFFGPDGEHLRSVGGFGGGPGEFADPASMSMCMLPDGSIRVDDALQGRFHDFTDQGEVTRTINKETHDEGSLRPQLSGCLPDGSWVGTGFFDLGRAQPGTVTRGEQAYYRVNADGGVINLVARVPSRPRFVQDIGGAVSYPFIPLTGDPSIAVNERVYTMAGEPEIRRWSPDGELTGLIRWRVARQATTDVWPRYRRESLTTISSDMQRERAERLYQEQLPIPEYVPVSAQLIIDGEHNLWVERYRLPWEEERMWEVFDPDGRWLGAVVLPEALRVEEIGGDYLLGVHTDDLGVQRVRLHQIAKGQA